MANVKVPALLHKMSKAAQKAWYKKNNMTMPSEVEGGGRSAAAAKRVVAPAPRKQMAAAPQSVRAMNTARQQAYYAKGGRQPIGAGGSGGSSSMAGVGQSSAKEIIKGIKAGYNPKVALVRYTNEEVEQVDEVTKKEAEETLGGPVKTKPKMPPGKQPEGYRYVRALARRAMKAGLKKEEVEQVDEAGAFLRKVIPGLGKKQADDRAEKHINTALTSIRGGEPANELARMKAAAKLKNIARGNKPIGFFPKEAKQMDEAGYQVIGTTKDKETFRSKVHPKKAEALSTHYKMAKSRKYKDIKLVKVQEEVEQVDEARRMSAAEKLGRAFDSEQQRSALSRQRGLDLLKQKDTEKMQNKLASGKMSPSEVMTKLKKEETEESTMKYIEEKLTAADPASKWISDFVKSDNPKFAGKSKKERIQQALGAYYAKKRGTNEEVEQIDELENKTLLSYVKKARGEGGGNSYLDALTLAPGAREKAEKRTKGLRAVQRALGRNFKAGKAGEEVYEEVEQVDEGRLRRSMRGYAVLGGYGYGNKVRYQSAGERSREINVGLDDKQEKENARRAAEADKAKMKKEEVEQIDELKKSTLASYVGKAAGRLAAASRLQKDFEKDGHTALAGEFEKSAQKKKVGIQKAANKLAKEEAEQIDELKASTLGSYIAKSSADEKSRREKGVAVSKELSAKTGMKFGTPFDPKIHSKNASRSANRAVAIKKLTGQAKVNANEAAEGKVAVTPKEKSLAAHHGDKTKITFGDVLKARLKSAAAKKMGK